MHTVIIGGGFAGIKAALELANKQTGKITLISNSPYFNCHASLYSILAGKSKRQSKVTLSDIFAHINGVDIVQDEVISINPEKNIVRSKDIAYEYDKLILSPGARAIRPSSIKGVDRDNVFTVKNVVDIDGLKKYIDNNNVQDVAVIGGGFIGLEVMESLREAGKNVTLVEGTDQILAPLDYDLVQVLNKEIYDKGVTLLYNEKLTEVEEEKIILESGKEVKAGGVVLAIGVLPEAELAKDAELEFGETGGILVNHHYQTSDPDIYAVGDVIEVTHFITNKKVRLTLAGPAQRQARAVADHLYGRTYRNTGVIGSSVVKIFDYTAASTGLNEKDCRKLGIDYDVAYIIPKDKVGLIPSANPIHFKLIFQVPTGQILGAQSVGMGTVEKRVDVIAAMIMNRANIEDLKELELCYSPYYTTAKDATNMAALVACNLLNGEYKQVRTSEVRSLVEEGAYIIDSRERVEYEAGHIKGAVNIPLSEFRDRLDEIPTDRPVYVHCLSSQRSYYMVRELNLRGYNNVVNISGSFLGISLYEYFTDVTTGREPIVTNYRFKLL